MLQLYKYSTCPPQLVSASLDHAVVFLRRCIGARVRCTVCPTFRYLLLFIVVQPAVSKVSCGGRVWETFFRGEVSVFSPRCAGLFICLSQFDVFVPIHSLLSYTTFFADLSIFTLIPPPCFMSVKHKRLRSEIMSTCFTVFFRLTFDISACIIYTGNIFCN